MEQAHWVDPALFSAFVSIIIFFLGVFLGRISLGAGKNAAPRSPSSTEWPDGPPKLPIIGNLHQLNKGGELLHHKLGDSILESPAGSFSSGTGSSAGVGGLLMSCRTLLSTATIEFVRKKRSSVAGRTVPLPASPTTAGADAGSRRKGVPNRAPLY